MSASSLFSGDTSRILNPNFGVPLVAPHSEREFIGWMDARSSAYQAGYFLALSGRSTVIPTDMEGVMSNAFVDGFDDGEREMDADKAASYEQHLDRLATASGFDVETGNYCW